MKLVIAAEIFEPDIGGPATFSKRLAQEFVNKGWQVSVLCYSNQPRQDALAFPVIRVLRGKSPLSRYARYFFALYSLARTADAVYAMGPVSSGLPAVLVGKLRRKKVAVKVVGDYAWEQAQVHSKQYIDIDNFQLKRVSGKIGLLKSIQRFSCRHASCVITPSQYLKKIVSGWGVPAEKIFVVYNAVSFPAAKRRLTDNEILLVSIGRLVSWKGFELLIDLLLELLKFDPRFKLLILGSGPDESKLKNKVAQLGLGEHVEIKHVTAEQRDEYLSRATAFVLNTGYEGLSHTILEVMAAGVPVITTDVCGNPELVENYKTGLLVPFNDRIALQEAILKIVNDESLQQALSAAAMAVPKNFSVEKMINETEKVLAGL